VITLISRATAINNVVDTGTAGLSPGDLYVFSAPYFPPSEPDEQIGSVDGRCVLIDPVAVRLDCSVTNELKGGGGLLAGDLMAFEPLTLSPASTSTLAPLRRARSQLSVALAGEWTGEREIKSLQIGMFVSVSKTVSGR